MIIKIPVLARPKKNSQEIRINRRTGKRYISQSQRYLNFEQECGFYLQQYLREMAITDFIPIDYPVTLKITFYFPDKKKRDIANFVNAIQDILVKFGVLKDDNSNIVKSLDGTRIIYEEGRQEIVIEIIKYEKDNN